MLLWPKWLNAARITYAGVSDTKKQRKNEVHIKVALLTTHRTQSNSRTLTTSEITSDVLDFLRTLAVPEKLLAICESLVSYSVKSLVGKLSNQYFSYLEWDISPQFKSY